MKRISAVLVFFILACSPTKTAWQPSSVSLTADCSKQANCTIELFANKSMLIEPTTNPDGIRYKLVEQSGTNVIVYKYDKIVKGNLQDAGYREEVVFEYDGKKDFVLNDGELQETKMLFGRFCYCKGQTGYYRVKQGRLSIDKNANTKLQFTITEVPQVIKEIQFVLK